MDINEIQRKLSIFSKERNWDQFQTPKNLAAALSVEASELLEVFQWLTDNQSRNLDKLQIADAKRKLLTLSFSVLV
jgi:dCTP diphosphatase